MARVFNETFFREYEGYRKGYTQNGFIVYYFEVCRMAKKSVPKEVLKHLPSDRELVFAAIEERRIRNKKPYTGFTFLESYGRKIYMFNNERIPKRIITKQEFEQMRDWHEQWRQRYDYYRQKQSERTQTQSNQPPPKEKPFESKKEEIPPKDSKKKEFYEDLSPYQLLKQYGITNKKEWRLWMLKNHPDKNSQTDEALVKLINMAANMIFDGM